VVERYDDALERLRDLERRADTDPNVKLSQVVGELRAVRDDILAERRDRINKDTFFHREIDRLQDTKVDKNPNAAKAFWITLSSAVGAIFALIVWLIEGAK
jgi:hypothetical protein